MDKAILENIIDKYHLEGIVNQVSIKIEKKILALKAISETKNLVVVVDTANFDLDDCTLSIYDTSRLIKMIKVLENEVSLGIETKGSLAKKLKISDSIFNLEYQLADPMMIPSAPKIEEPEYEMEMNIDIDFINNFIKGEKAIDSEIFTIQSVKNKKQIPTLKFNLGTGGSHANKVSFFKEATNAPESDTVLTFPIKQFKEVLSSNKDLETGTLYLSEQGLLKLKFQSTSGVNATYLLVANDGE